MSPVNYSREGESGVIEAQTETPSDLYIQCQYAPEDLRVESESDVTELGFPILELFGGDEVAGAPQELTWPSTQDLQSLDVSKLSAQQLAAAGIARLSPQQLQALSREQTESLRADQIQALSDDVFYLDVRHLTPAQIGALSAEQLRALNLDDTRHLSPDQVRAIAPANLAGMTPWQLRYVGVDGFTAEQIRALTTEQLNVCELTSDQFRELTPGQIQRMEHDSRVGTDVASELRASGTMARWITQLMAVGQGNERRPFELLSEEQRGAIDFSRSGSLSREDVIWLHENRNRLLTMRQRNDLELNFSRHVDGLVRQRS